MYNWSIDEKILRQDKEKYAIWRIEQMVNYGLAGEKIKSKEIRKYFAKINIEPSRRKFLSSLLNLKNEKNLKQKSGLFFRKGRGE